MANLEELRLPTARLESDTKRAEDALLGVGRAADKVQDDLLEAGRGGDKAGDDLIRLRRELDRVQGELRQTSERLDKAEKDLLQLGKRGRRTGKDLEGLNSKVKQLFAGFTVAAVVNEFRKVVKEAADVETALIGVGKTADIAGPALAALGDSVEQLSLASGGRLTATNLELLGIAKTAGQLGIKGTKNIEVFVDTIAKLGSASDLVGEEGAAALASLLNITGESVARAPILASAIVKLGNDFSTTERQIAHHAAQVARATVVYDIGSERAAAYGTVLATFKVRAELAGSATGRAFRTIDKAVRGGGADLAALAKVARVSGDEIADAFGRDPVEAFDLFLGGLRQLIEEEGDYTGALESIGLSGTEILSVLPVLAKNQDTVNRALSAAATEVANATALNEEYQRTLDSLNADLALFKNEWEALRKELGDQVNPKARETVTELSRILEELRLISELAPQAGAALGGMFTFHAEDPGLFALRLKQISEGFFPVIRDVRELEPRLEVLRRSLAVLAGDDENMWAMLREELQLSLQSFADFEGISVAAMEQAGARFIAEIQAEEEAAAKAAVAAKALNAIWGDYAKAAGVIKEVELAKEIDQQAKALHALLGEASPGIEILKEFTAETLNLARAQELVAEAMKLAEGRKLDLGVPLFDHELLEKSARVQEIIRQAEEDLLRMGAERTEKEKLRASILREIETRWEAIARIQREVKKLVDDETITKEEGAVLLAARVEGLNDVQESSQSWLDTSLQIAQVLGGIDSELGRIVNSAVAVVGAFRQIQSASGGAERALGGAQLGVGLAGAAGTFGSGDFAQGGSALGGALGGAFAGAKFGAAAGPWGAVIGAAAGLLIGGLIDGMEETAQSYGALVSESGRLIVDVSEAANQELARETERALQIVASSINAIADRFGATAVWTQLALQIRETGDGVFKVWVDGILHTFDSIEKATDFAVVEGVKRATFVGLSPIAQAAIDRFVGSTQAELQSALTMAFDVEQLGIPASARAFQNQIDEYLGMLRALPEGAANILGEFGAGGAFQSEYNRLFGLQDDARALRLAEITALEAHIAVTRVDLEVQQAELLSMQLAAEARGAGVQVQAAATQAFLDIADAGARGIGGFGHAMGAAGIVAGISAETIANALAAIDEALSVLDNLDFSPGAIQAALDRIPTGGFGGGFSGPSQEQQRLDQLEAERERIRETNLALIRADELGSRWNVSLADVNEELERQLGVLGPLAMTTEGVTGHTEAHNEALRAQGILLQQLGEEALGSLGTSMFGFRQDAQATAETIAFLTENAARLGINLREVDAAIDEIQLANFESVFRRLLGFMDEATVGAELAEKAQQALIVLEQFKFQIEMQALKAQVEVWTELGLLSEGQRDALDQAFAVIDENMDAILEGISDDITGAGDDFADSVNQAAANIELAASGFAPGTSADSAFLLLQQLSDLQAQGTGAPLTAVDQANLFYDDLLDQATGLAGFFAAFGTSLEEVTAQIEDLRDLEIQRLFEGTIGEVQQSLLPGGRFSTASNREQLATIQRQINEAIAAGDFERAAQLAQTGLSIAQQTSARIFGEFSEFVLSLSLPGQVGGVSGVGVTPPGPDGRLGPLGMLTGEDSVAKVQRDQLLNVFEVGIAEKARMHEVTERNRFRQTEEMGRRLGRVEAAITTQTAWFQSQGSRPKPFAAGRA